MKSKKLILISHCILNQNAVIEGWERASGAFPVSKLLIEAGLGIIQLPCPELIFKGMERPSMTYSGYNTPKYQELCRELLAPYISQIKNYMANGYVLQGLIGIHNSPTCSISGQRGVLMEALFDICEKENIPLRYVEIPEEYTASTQDKDLENKIIELMGAL